MPNQSPVSAFLTEEWERFSDALNSLDPRVADALYVIENQRRRMPGESATITVPGWDQVIKLGPRTPVQPTQWAEFYKAQREGRRPNLPYEVQTEIAWSLLIKEANRTSAQPRWSQTMGQLFTALDNVQDFASTLATFGRLLLWGGVPVLNWALPGFAGSTATRIGLEASRAAAAKLALELGGRAGWNAAFIDASAQAIARQATARAALGFGSRLALRFVPVVGWIVLASDLLNLMGFFGMIATPLYALLCNGPREALLSGVPAAVLKNALCREVWTQARRNPFGRQARAAAQMKALGRLPSVSNLIEVAQTTDNLWGVGLSFGTLYAMALEALFSASSNTPFSNVSVNTGPLVESLGGAWMNELKNMTATNRGALEQAAQVMLYSTALANRSDLLADEDHMLHMATLLGAVPLVQEFFSKGPHEEFIAEFSALTFRAPNRVTPEALAALGDDAAALSGAGKWWVDGLPEQLTGEQLILATAPDVRQAVTDFLKPRRNRPDAGFYGAALNTITEQLWYMIGGGPDSLKWELAPDSKLLTGMMVDGLIIPDTADEGDAWRLWQAMHAELDRRGGKLLEGAKVVQLAQAADVPIMRLLAPDAPFPNAWAPWFAEHGDPTARDVTPCPTCGAPHG